MDIMTIMSAAEAASGTNFKASNADLMAELCTRCGGEIRGDALFASHQGLDFRLRFHRQQPTFALSIVCPEVGRFKLTRKRGLDRWMEAFVPARPFRSRNARFDRDFSVQTRDHEVTTAILTNPKSQAAVRSLMQRCCMSVRLEDGRMKALGSRKALGVDPDAGLILRMLEQLAPLAGAVQHFAKHHEIRPAVKRDPVVIACWLALGAMGLTGLMAVILGSMHYPVVERAAFVGWSALASMFCVGSVVFGLAFAVQRRSSPYGLVCGLTATSLLVIPVFVSGVLLLVNGSFDRTAAQEHVALILNKSARENDEGRVRYRAGLDAWWTDGDMRWVRISKGTYDSIVPDQTKMRVRTHPGWLGRPWIEDYQVQP